MLKNITLLAILTFFIREVIALPENLDFSMATTTCKMPKSGALPKKYHRYPWASGIKNDETLVGGAGQKFIGSMEFFYTFLKADINNDGWCDWLVTLDIPASTGGDRDSVNTFYLGEPNGWRRVGEEVHGADRPEDFGKGANSKYSFFETASILYEKTEKKTYVVGLFLPRNGGRFLKPGYHLYVWSRKENNLVELNKWGSGRDAGSQAYAYFKTHGAFRGGAENSVEEFDPEEEEMELQRDKTNLVRVCVARAISDEHVNRCNAARIAYPDWFQASP